MRKDIWNLKPTTNIVHLKAEGRAMARLLHCCDMEMALTMPEISSGTVLSNAWPLHDKDPGCSGRCT